MKTTEKQIEHVRLSTAHTPAPWKFKQHENDCEIFSDDWGPIAETKGGHASKAERLANGQLIAAAPELLETLKAIVTHGEPIYPADWVRMKAAGLAAIAKATGGAR